MLYPWDAEVVEFEVGVSCMWVGKSGPCFVHISPVVEMGM